jgi:hypothetical protein
MLSCRVPPPPTVAGSMPAFPAAAWPTWPMARDATVHDDGRAVWYRPRDNISVVMNAYGHCSIFPIRLGYGDGGTTKYGTRRGGWSSCQDHLDPGAEMDFR